MSHFTDFFSAQANPEMESVEDIYPDELDEKKSGVVLIDVREPHEFVGELGHIPGAQLISLGQLQDRFEELPEDQTVVFICRSGARSAHATALAKDRGLQSVYNLKGGMLLWNQMGLQVERD